MTKKLFTGLALGVVLAGSAGAQLLSETFTYPDGALVGAAGSSWINNTGTAGQVNIVSGELFLDDSETEDVRTSFSSQLTTGIVSATFQLRIDPADVPTSTTGNYFAHFIGDTDGLGNSSDFIGRVFTRTPNVAAAGAFSLGISNSTGTGASAVFFGSDFTAGINYSLTLSYNFATSTASLSVAGVGMVSATDAAALITRIDSIGFRQSTLTGDQFIDNLTVTAVPEPHEYALAVAGLLAVVVVMRRRKAAQVF